MINFQVIVGDITKIEADAIVNAASPYLLGGGGVDGAIHRAAGPELLKECKTLHGCDVGGAKTTKAYNLPAKYVIHAVGPNYRDYEDKEAKYLLKKTYCSLLDEALNRRVKTMTIPAISCGIYAFPLEEAVKIALHTINDYKSVPHGFCDATAMPIDEWGLTNIIFVVSSEEIANLYRHEITLVEEENEAWHRLLKLISNKEKPSIFDLPSFFYENKKKIIKDLDIKQEITDTDIQDVVKILEKHPDFAKKHNSHALYRGVCNKNPKAIEFIEILLKYGADKNRLTYILPDKGPYTLVQMAGCPEIKKFLISLGVLSGWNYTPPTKQDEDPEAEVALQ